jgi:hypothetical protein
MLQGSPLLHFEKWAKTHQTLIRGQNRRLKRINGEIMVDEESCRKHGGKWVETTVGGEKLTGCQFPGEIVPPKFIRVHYEETTNWGWDKKEVKYFNTEKDAENYASALVEDLKELESDDPDSVVIEDNKGEPIATWMNEMGTVEKTV